MALGSSIGQGVGSLAGGIANLAGLAGPGGEDKYRDALRVWEKLQTSDFDMRSLSPPELRVVAEVFPALYDAAVPTEMQEIAGSPEAREAQVESLTGMRELGRTGLTDVDRLSNVRAQEAMAQSSRREREAVLRNLAARGQLGGGDELQARLATTGEQANQASDMGARLAEQAALRRVGAMGSAGQMAGQLRAADVGEQTARADVSQRFNELVYGALNRANQQNAAMQQQADMWNAGNVQNIANQNELARYQSQLSDIERQNRLRAGSFGQDVTKAEGQTGALKTLGGYKDQQQANRISGIQGAAEGAGGIVGGLFDFF